MRVLITTVFLLAIAAASAHMVTGSPTYQQQNYMNPMTNMQLEKMQWMLEKLMDKKDSSDDDGKHMDMQQLVIMNLLRNSMGMGMGGDKDKSMDAQDLYQMLQSGGMGDDIIDLLTQKVQMNMKKQEMEKEANSVAKGVCMMVFLMGKRVMNEIDGDDKETIDVDAGETGNMGNTTTKPSEAPEAQEEQEMPTEDEAKEKMKKMTEMSFSEIADHPPVMSDDVFGHYMYYALKMACDHSMKSMKFKSMMEKKDKGQCSGDSDEDDEDLKWVAELERMKDKEESKDEESESPESDDEPEREPESETGEPEEEDEDGEDKDADDKDGTESEPAK